MAEDKGGKPKEVGGDGPGENNLSNIIHPKTAKDLWSKKVEIAGAAQVEAENQMNSPVKKN